MTCPRCGLPDNTMLDGYAPPEDAELVLESLGPHMVKRYAANLRAALAGGLAESLVLRLDRGKNGAAIWKVQAEAMEQVIVVPQRKRA